MSLLALESSEGPRLLAVIPGTSHPLYLDCSWVFRKGTEMHIPQSETVRLVCAKRSHFFKKESQAETILWLPRKQKRPHLGRVSRTCSGAAARWLSTLLDLGVVAKCSAGVEASHLATGVSPPLPELQATTGPAHETVKPYPALSLFLTSAQNILWSMLSSTGK